MRAVAVGVCCWLVACVMAVAQPVTHQTYAEWKPPAILPKPQRIVCRQDTGHAHTYRLPPTPGARARQTPTARIEVTYNDFPADAQAAFQYAADIWATLIASPVPIRIQANWVRQAPGILGSAGPAEVRMGSDGAQKADAYYPIALAEKIARRDLNDPTSPDIIATFNANNDWYFGTDGKPISNTQTDFVTAVLHELTHGLGFIGYFDVLKDSVGLYLADPYASVYDHFLRSYSEKHIVAARNLFPNNSFELKQQLSNGYLWLDGPQLKQKTGQMIRLHAKFTFDRAQSIYHLDEDIYPAGDPNALLTPKLKIGEVNHTPGPLVLAFFNDLEWKTTSLLHTPPPSSETPTDIPFTVKVISDTTLSPGSLRLFYRKSAPTATDKNFMAITPTLQAGTTDTYTYLMPAATAQGHVWYYFQVQESSGRALTNPGRLVDNTQVLYHVQLGPDNVPPTIKYSPDRNFIFDTTRPDSLLIRASLSDDRPTGISSASVEYSINNGPTTRLPLTFSPTTIDSVFYDSLYVARIALPPHTLKPGDKLRYRLVVQDASKARNAAASPAAGMYELQAPVLQPTRNQYQTTFDPTSVTDVAGFRMAVATPEGFTDPALHSIHPYPNGTDFRSQQHAEAVLLAPIRLHANPDSAVLRFSEIVLTEPGELSSTYGQAAFYDYVVVEGSRDKGLTWLPLADGYDARDQPDWLKAYTSKFETGIHPTDKVSTALGVPALYRTREIFMLKNGHFQAGETILIRFRLFSDQLAHGWGWAIDNLRVQLPPAPPVLATETPIVAHWRIYPNPATQTLTIEADWLRPTRAVTMTLSNPNGQAILRQTAPISGTTLSASLDVTTLAAGLYVLHISDGQAFISRNILIAP